MQVRNHQNTNRVVGQEGRKEERVCGCQVMLLLLCSLLFSHLLLLFTFMFLVSLLSLLLLHGLADKTEYCSKTIRLDPRQISI